MATMIETNRFYRAIRDFAVTEPVWSAVRQTYMTLPDERWDLTLVARRVYGDPAWYLAIMAAAGLHRVDDELTERLLILPTRERLQQIATSLGYSPLIAGAVR